MKRTEAVDRIGQIDAEVKALMAEREKLVAKFSVKARLGTFVGQGFRLTCFQKQNTWLDPRKVRRAVGAANMAKLYSKSTTWCSRVSPLSAPATTEE